MRIVRIRPDLATNGDAIYVTKSRKSTRLERRRGSEGEYNKKFSPVYAVTSTMKDSDVGGAAMEAFSPQEVQCICDSPHWKRHSLVIKDDWAKSYDRGVVRPPRDVAEWQTLRT